MIYIRQLISFRAPLCWFIGLAVATCHIQYMFLSLCHFFPTRKRTLENTRSPPFSYDTKMATDGYWARKALILREQSLIDLGCFANIMYRSRPWLGSLKLKEISTQFEQSVELQYSFLRRSTESLNSSNDRPETREPLLFFSV